MQKGHTLSFHCPTCKSSVLFSIFNLSESKGMVGCPGCKRNFDFNDPTLRRHLEKFEALCEQIADSEEILSQVSVGVDVAGKQVKIPYKLLLTRLNSMLDLQIGDQKLTIEFRMEPLKESRSK